MPDAVTLLYGESDSSIVDARVEGDDLWLGFNDLARSTGWVIKPEGACLGATCVELPQRERKQYLRRDENGEQFNLAALARLLEMPVAVERRTNTWCFGESASARADSLDALDAPDFRLPDLSGRMHALSDYRGKKVFLIAWASW
jgi:hypothetical protein